MAIIKCPECSKEISDKSKQCIYCGFPLNEDNICIINGTSYNLSFVLDETISYADKLVKFVQTTKCHFTECSNVISMIQSSGAVPQTLTLKTIEQYRLEQSKPHCPKCNSTNIQAVARKWSLFTGFMTNKVDRVCVNCKHKF